MESWKTHLTDGIMKDPSHLLDGSFMIPSVRWVFHDSIWQMGLSWFHLADGSFMIWQMESWKTHLTDGIMKDPSHLSRWVFHDSICQDGSFMIPSVKMGLSWFHLSRWVFHDSICQDGSFMIPSGRWVFHDFDRWNQMGLSWFHLSDGSLMIPSVMRDPSDRWNQMGLSWFHLLDGSFMIPSVRWVFHDSVC